MSNYLVAELISVDSKYAISVPNGQALYLLSLMINSGMSANEARLGWKGTGMFSRRATYEYVGCGSNGMTLAKVSEDLPLARADYDKAALDTNDESWLIQNYTADTTSITYAQSMANKTAATVTLSKSDYVLPDGFRGIGNFNKINSNNENLVDTLHLKVTTFDGKGAAIYQNTKYWTYNSDNYLPINNELAGLGLFTYQGQAGTYKDFTLSGNVKCDWFSANGKSAGISGYSSVGRLSVGTLFGVTNVQQSIDSVVLVNLDAFGLRYSGGLIGNVPSDTTKTISITNTQSYDSVNVKVHGAGMVGGLIGRSRQGGLIIDYNNNTFSINEIASESNSSSGYIYDKGVGGLVGVWRGNYNKNSNTVSISNIIIENATSTKNAEVKCTYTNCNYNTAGVIGTLNRSPLTVENCEIKNVTCKTNGGYLGGVVGYCPTYSQITITNTDISTGILKAEIANTGKNTGGFIGGNGAGDSEAGFSIKNSSITGYTISGSENVGGAVGGRNFDSTKLDEFWGDRNMVIQNFKIIDCTIKGNKMVGGILGYLGFYEFQGYNIYSDNLTFSRYSGTGSIENLGCVLGYNMTDEVPYSGDKPNDAKNKLIGGYKAVKIVGFSRQNVPVGAEKLIGNDDYGVDSTGLTGYIICADYQGSSQNPISNEMKSVTKYNTSVNEETGVVTVTPETFNQSYNTFPTVFNNGTNVTNSFQVLYEQDAYDEDNGNQVIRNTKDEIIKKTVSYQYPANWPNVTSSPAYILYSKENNQGLTEYSSLTGDAVSRINYDADINSGASKSAAKSILDDMLAGNSAPKRYQNTGIPLTSDNANALTITKLSNWLGTEKKYSDFKSEFKTPSDNLGLPKSFPVLLVDDVTIVNDLVNGYLQVLTNTSYNFASSTEASENAAVYKLNIANCEFNTDTKLFEPDYDTAIYDTINQTTKASLYTDGNVFKIRRYDNQNESKLQFTLIDLAFYDPSDSTHTNIAYHLYVPVFVKKQLRFTFEVSAKTGTDYLMSGYLTGADGNSLRGKTMIENFGNPVTMEFRYTYDRKLSEWKTLIESGTEFPNYSYNKILNVTSHTQESPGPMIMVLLDPNASSKTDYTPNQVYTGGTITQVDSSNYTIDLESFSDYTRKTMNDFFSITLSTDAETKAFRAVVGNETADIIDKNGTGWKYVGTAEGSGATHGISDFKYADGRSGNDDKIMEDYYITFYTERPALNSNCTFALTEAEAVDTDEAAQNSVMYVIDPSGSITARRYTSASSYVEETIREATISEKKNAASKLYTLEKIYHYDFSSPRTLGNTEFPTLISNSQAVNLYVGDLYDTTLTVDTYHSDEDHVNQDEKLTENDARIHVDLSADISFTDSASRLIGDAVKSNNGISVYQSLMYSFNRQDMNESSGNSSSEYVSTKGILSEQAPIMSNLVYTVKGESITAELDETSKNFIELKNNQNIKNDIVNGITIAASFDLDYDSDTEITAQFPKRGSDSNDGTCVVGYSRIASSPQATKYSKTSTEINGDALYYCELDSTAKLYYNAKLRPDSSSDDDESEVDVNDADIDDLDQLGINAFDPIASQIEHISSVAVYDVSSVATSTLKEAKTIRLVFHLRGKWDNYSSNQVFSRFILADVEDEESYTEHFIVSANNATNTSLASPWVKSWSDDGKTIP